MSVSMIPKHFFILVESLPDNGDIFKYSGARALTSPSGNGVVLQHMELYEYHFDSGIFTWSKIQHTLSHPVTRAVMTYLPAGYTCIGKRHLESCPTVCYNYKGKKVN